MKATNVSMVATVIFSAVAEPPAKVASMLHDAALLSTLIFSAAAAEPPAKLPACWSDYEDDTTVCYPDFGIARCEDLRKSPKFVDFTDDDALAHCQEMCGGAGVVPFLLGVNRQGVQKSFMNKLCLGKDLAENEPPVLQENGTLVHDCQERLEMVKSLKEDLGQFIAAYEAIEIKTTEYGVRVQNSVPKLNEHMQRTLNEKFREDLMRDKLKTLVNAKNDAMLDFMPDNGEKFKMITAVEKMAELGETLIENLEYLDPKLKNFKDECIQITALKAGPKHADMQDICATNSYRCLSNNDADEVEHIGCCCGGVPAIMTSLTASGDGMHGQCRAKPVLEGNSTGGGRRLRGALGRLLSESRNLQGGFLSGSAVTDACSYATQLLMEVSAEVMRELESEGLPTDSIEKLMHHHREIQCPAPDRRLSFLDDVQSSPNDRRLTDAVFPSTVKSCVRRPHQPAHPDWPYANKHVRTVTGQAYDGHCEELGIAEMNKKCNEFCGNGTVPFLIGTTQFGFSHAEADEVCLKLSGEMMNPDKVTECLELVDGLQERKVTVAKLQTELNNLDFRLMELTASTKNSTADLVEWLRNEAPSHFKLMNKGEEFKVLQAFAAQVESLPAGNHIIGRAVQTVVADVRLAASHLKRALRQLVDETRQLVNECDFMAAGWDSRNNYMLDICKVAGDKCLHEEEANSASCCCGVMPLAKMGKSVDFNNIIPGDGAPRRLMSATGAEEPRRRLVEEPSKSICEIVEETLAPIRSQQLSELTKAGHSDMVLEYEQHRHDICETTTTTTTTTTTSVQPRVVLGPGLHGCYESGVDCTTNTTTSKDKLGQEKNHTGSCHQTSVLSLIALPGLLQAVAV